MRESESNRLLRLVLVRVSRGKKSAGSDDRGARLTKMSGDGSQARGHVRILGGDTRTVRQGMLKPSWG